MDDMRREVPRSDHRRTRWDVLIPGAVAALAVLWLGRLPWRIVPADLELATALGLQSIGQALGWGALVAAPLLALAIAGRSTRRVRTLLALGLVTAGILGLMVLLPAGRAAEGDLVFEKNADAIGRHAPEVWRTDEVVAALATGEGPDGGSVGARLRRLLVFRLFRDGAFLLALAGLAAIAASDPGRRVGWPVSLGVFLVTTAAGVVVSMTWFRWSLPFPVLAVLQVGPWLLAALLVGEWLRRRQGGGAASSLVSWVPRAGVGFAAVVLGLGFVAPGALPGALPPPATVGEPAPPLVARLLSGGRFDLEDHEGDVVLVTYWASWCGPCRSELAFLSGVEPELEDRGFTVLAVNVDEPPDVIEDFLEEHPLPFAVATSAGRGLDAWPSGLPASYVIDRDGVVRAHHRGFTPERGAALRSELEQLLGEGEGAPAAGDAPRSGG